MEETNMVKNKRGLLLCLIVIFGGLLAPSDYMLHTNAKVKGKGNNNIIHYTIKKDDTFYLLSERFNSSLKNIVSMNSQLDPLNLRIGTEIKVLVGSGIKIHHVKKGDTLGNLAVTYHNNVYSIADKNDILNPNVIYSGDILAIPEDDMRNPTNKTVSKKKINAIVNDLNQSELNKHSSLNARYENGWIKIDNILFNIAAHKWAMSIVDGVLDNHNVKINDYTVENVVWEHPQATAHWGTVCIKIVKK